MKPERYIDRGKDNNTTGKANQREVGRAEGDRDERRIR